MPPESQLKSPSSNPTRVLVLGPGLEVRWPWGRQGRPRAAQHPTVNRSQRLCPRPRLRVGTEAALQRCAAASEWIWGCGLRTAIPCKGFRGRS